MFVFMISKLSCYSESLGSFFWVMCSRIGEYLIFLLKSFFLAFIKPFYFVQIFKHIKEIGFYSLPVVGLTSIFTGAVLALQSYSSFQRFSAESSTAIVVVLSITRELGPVLAGLMVAGRIGAANAAEIASMRVTEQIDALITLSTKPIKYLVSPRVISSVLIMPFLVIIADIIGVFGGYLVAIWKLDFNGTVYLQNTVKYLEFIDVFQGLVKASVFGFFIAVTSCFFGYNSPKGAQGVGYSTTAAVVFSSIMVLFSNYAITYLFFG